MHTQGNLTTSPAKADHVVYLTAIINIGNHDLIASIRRLSLELQRDEQAKQASSSHIAVYVLVGGLAHTEEVMDEVTTRIKDQVVIIWQ